MFYLTKSLAGFNPDEPIAVLPTCTDEENPSKYPPISTSEASTFPHRLVITLTC